MFTRKLIVLTISSLLVFSSWVRADTPFTDVFVFGDSLSDTGNFGAFVGGLGFPFFENRISNGPVAVDVQS